MEIAIQGSLLPNVHEQIERLVTSDLFKGSDALCRILRYLAGRACDTKDSVTEYVLATEVLGRHPDKYDSVTDSCVRVQIMRLRSKLAQYYSGPGATDSIVINVPRGAYRMVAEERSITLPVVDLPAGRIAYQPIGRRPITYRQFVSPWSVGLVGAVCLLFGVLLGMALTLSETAGKLTP